MKQIIEADTEILKRERKKGSINKCYDYVNASPQDEVSPSADDVKYKKILYHLLAILYVIISKQLQCNTVYWPCIR